MLLTTTITGDDSPSAQVARTIFAPYTGSVYSAASRRLPDHVLSCDCCQSVLSAGTGIHALVPGPALANVPVLLLI